MVQVDIFWAYGWGASLAAASGRQLSSMQKPLESKYWPQTLIFLSLFWAPTGLLLLIRHPSWETMQAAEDLYHMSEWVILAFGITNVTQGMLGFWIGQRLMRAGKYWAAQLNWLVGYFGMFFILLYGWDGLGYDRFLYDRDMFAGSPAWAPGAGTGEGVLSALSIFLLTFRNLEGGATVITTLLTDGLWLLPPFFFLYVRWLQDGVRAQGMQPAGAIPTMLIYGIIGIFGIGFATAAFSALVVGMLAHLLSVGDVIWHGSFYAPENLARHWAAYIVGLPLSLLIAWYGWLKPGRLAHRLLHALAPDMGSNDLKQ